jgi:hypothetical protein
MSKDSLPPPDPSVQFQEWVTQWERAVDEFSNKVMGTDEFSKSMNQMQGLQIEFQRRFGELMAKQLANLNMPSRDDILRLSEDVRNIDRRLSQIERTINRLADQSVGGSANAGRPARTKKPPAKKAPAKKSPAKKAAKDE